MPNQVIPDLYYCRDGRYRTLPPWASFFIELGRFAGNAPREQKRLVLSAAMPTSAFAAAFTAAGVTTARASMSLPIDPYQYAEDLSKLPLGTGVWLRGIGPLPGRLRARLGPLEGFRHGVRMWRGSGRMTPRRCPGSARAHTAGGCALPGEMRERRRLTPQCRRLTPCGCGADEGMSLRTRPAKPVGVGCLPASGMTIRAIASKFIVFPITVNKKQQCEMYL